MRRNGWKGRKAEEAGQPADEDRGGSIVADDCSSSQLPRQDENPENNPPTESDATAPDLKKPRLTEEPRPVQDGATLESVAELPSETLEDSEIGDEPDDAGEAADEDGQGDAIGWTIQLSRGRIVDVTDRHVLLSDDSLGFITFEDGESLSIEGIRRIGW